MKRATEETGHLDPNQKSPYIEVKFFTASMRLFSIFRHEYTSRYWKGRPAWRGQRSSGLESEHFRGQNHSIDAGQFFRSLKILIDNQEWYYDSSHI
jgi:hypothetical protein